MLETKFKMWGALTLTTNNDLIIERSLNMAWIVDASATAEALRAGGYTRKHEIARITLRW